MAERPRDDFKCALEFPFFAGAIYVGDVPLVV